METPIDINQQESLEEFKNSFSYGSRSDLNFKFLKSFTPAEAANFISELAHTVGDSINDGSNQRLLDLIFAGQKKAYSKVTNYIYEEGPFTNLKKPLSQSTVALLTSSGHFVEEDDPKPFEEENMSQEDAEARITEFVRSEPVLSSIPIETPLDKICVRHGGYDTRATRMDPQVTLPIEVMRKLDNESIFGRFHPITYSFVGACSQSMILKRTGPDWVRFFKEEKIDAMLLVPV